jgi:hypothetical protein
LNLPASEIKLNGHIHRAPKTLDAMEELRALTSVMEALTAWTIHDASLSLPAVKDAIPRGEALVVKFGKIAVTNPVWVLG